MDGVSMWEYRARPEPRRTRSSAGYVTHSPSSRGKPPHEDHRTNRPRRDSDVRQRNGGVPHSMAVAGPACRRFERRDRFGGGTDHAPARSSARTGDLDEFRRLHHPAERGAYPRIGYSTTRPRAREIWSRSRAGTPGTEAGGRAHPRALLGSRYRRPRGFQLSAIPHGPRNYRGLFRRDASGERRTASASRHRKTTRDGNRTDEPLDVATTRQSRAAVVADRRRQLVFAAVSRLRPARQFQRGHGGRGGARRDVGGQRDIPDSRIQPPLFRRLRHQRLRNRPGS